MGEVESAYDETRTHIFITAFLLAMFEVMFKGNLNSSQRVPAAQHW
jgi:hypothetical protein